MNEKDFANSKTGKLVWEQNGMYFRFEPKELPLDFQPDPALSDLLMSTALVLGRLDGMSQKFSQTEVEMLIAPLILKEAQLSSEIEGTRSTLTDVYKEEKQKETDVQKAIDNALIRNYARALRFGLTKLEQEFSEELIKEMHKVLLEGVRGHDKEPGEYKTAQNAIGSRQDTLETAKFVPSSFQSTPFLMKNLVKFMNDNKQMNPLFKIAIAHYQFEAIHPFRDGNGRIGRLLISLSLSNDKVLSHPLLYISEYFNRNRSTYTDKLYEVSSSNKINEWVFFFLKALETQATNSLELLQQLDDYKSELQEKTSSVSKSSKMHLVVESIFKNPFITITDVADELGMSIPGASNLVHKLEEIKVLKEVTGKQTGKIYVAQRILDILEGRYKHKEV
jgi:Fic family protein